MANRVAAFIPLKNPVGYFGWGWVGGWRILLVLVFRLVCATGFPAVVLAPGSGRHVIAAEQRSQVPTVRPGREDRAIGVCTLRKVGQVSPADVLCI